MLTLENKNEIINNYLSGKTQDQIAAEYHVCKKTLRKMLIDEGITIRTFQQTKGVDYNLDNVVDLYKSGLSAYEIQRQVGCKSVNTIYNLLRKHCEIRNGTHGKNWNANMKKDFFKEPLSEHAQYWIGFLYADGSIIQADTRNKSSQIRLTLAETDKILIDKFKEDLCIDNKIYKIEKEPQNAYSIALRNKEMISDLSKYGIIPRKTWIHTNFIGNELTLTGHMLRGFFDGDGWIVLTPDGLRAAVGFVGNYYAIEELKTALTLKVGCNPDARIVAKGGNGIKSYWPRISYVRLNDICKLYDFMYKDATIFLERKRDKFKTLFKNRLEHGLKLPLPSLLEIAE